MHRQRWGWLIIIPAVMVLSRLTEPGVLGQWKANVGGMAKPSSMVHHAWRALPSETRFARRADGMLPSENRANYLRSGTMPYSGGLARVSQPTRRVVTAPVAPVPGSIRYGTGRAPAAAWPGAAVSQTRMTSRTARAAFARPITPSATIPYRRPSYGSIRHGKLYTPKALSGQRSISGTRGIGAMARTPFARPVAPSSGLLSSRVPRGTIRYGAR